MPYRTIEARKAYAAQWYVRVARKKRREWWKGKACVKCGATERLELDHIEPLRGRSERIDIWLASDERREAELAKCQVLCKPCHQVKTNEEMRANPPIWHPSGSQLSYARLNEDQVREIKRLLRDNPRRPEEGRKKEDDLRLTHSDIAEMFGVTRSLIADISAGRTWKHVD